MKIAYGTGVKLDFGIYGSYMEELTLTIGWNPFI